MDDQDQPQTIGQLMELLSVLRQEKADADANCKRINAQIDSVKRSILEQLEDLGLDKITASGMTCTRNDSYWVNYNKDEFGDFIRWCTEKDRFDLIQRRLNTAPIKELIDSGEEIPAGVRLELKTDLSIRKA